MIESKNLTIQYIKEYATIFDVSFSIKSNTMFLAQNDEISALFRTIAKIEKNYEGNCYIDSENIRNIKDKNLNLGYVPSSPFLFSRKTVKQNLIYPLIIRKENKNSASTKVDNIINKYLYDFPQKTKLLDLSQRKIVALLRTILWQPKYLLIEHFFENLDPKYLDFAQQIISSVDKNTIIVASENKITSAYKNYQIISLENGSIKNDTKIANY